MFSAHAPSGRARAREIRNIEKKRKKWRGNPNTHTHMLGHLALHTFRRSSVTADTHIHIERGAGYVAFCLRQIA